MYYILVTLHPYLGSISFTYLLYIHQRNTCVHASVYVCMSLPPNVVPMILFHSVDGCSCKHQDVELSSNSKILILLVKVNSQADFDKQNAVKMVI